MEIKYNEFVAELSRRSLANYSFIKVREDEDKLYAVTQLINSMYCMIVVPEEIFGINHRGEQKTEFGIREKNLKRYHNEYQKIRGIINKLEERKRFKYLTVDEYVQNNPVCAFINNLRNSLCHEGIGFLPIQTEEKGKPKNKITDVIFESKSMHSRKPTFIAVIDIDTLEKLMEAVSSLYCKVEEGRDSSNADKYREYYRELEKHVEEHLPDYRFYNNN